VADMSTSFPGATAFSQSSMIMEWNGHLWHRPLRPAEDEPGLSRHTERPYPRPRCGAALPVLWEPTPSPCLDRRSA
jgi:hypothetical protein